MFRDWSLITGKGGGGASEVLPLRKGGGGAEQGLAMMKGGGHNKFWYNVNTGAWSFSHFDGGGGGGKQFWTCDFPIL